MLFHPYVRSIADLLAKRGAEFDIVIMSRHYVAVKHIDAVRAFAPRALVVFDTVDLHFLRTERQAELEGSALARASARAKRDEELSLIRKADVTLVVSTFEQTLLKELVPDARVLVLSTIHEPAAAGQAVRRARGPRVHRRLPASAQHRCRAVVRAARCCRTCARRCRGS